MDEQVPSVAVVIPTRSRPAKLQRCLNSLSAARQRLPFPVYVCDSSPEEDVRTAVRKVCERYDWVTLSTHDGANIAAARNACTRAAREDLLVNVDDDLELEPGAIVRLLERYEEDSGPRVVGGSLSWDGIWTTPNKIRPIGYSRPPRDGEEPDFIIGGFYLCPRSIALALPHSERIDRFDDLFMGALWRSHGVKLLYAEDARGLHAGSPASSDRGRIPETVHNERSHIYALLFDSLIANPSLIRAISYETLGFAARAKLYLWRPRCAIPFIRSWVAGHRQLIKDWAYLRALVRDQALSVDDR